MTTLLKKIKNNEITRVYDIEVEDDHHYLLEDNIVSHNSGVIYAASIVVAMKQLKLKEDEAGVKTKEVLGIRAGCKVMKTRFNKPFEDIELQIPYDTGMSPYSGFFDLIEKKGLVTKEGNRYCYTDLDGVIHKYFRKEWSRNDNNIMDLVMKEFHEKEAQLSAVAPAVDDIEE